MFIPHLQQSPWYTTYLFYPQGTSLLGHALNPFNGFLSLLLTPFLTLAQAYNVLLLLGFVGGGLTACWLAYYLTRAYWPSLIAGGIFTFANYHFMHAEGHLELVSLEWIPLFVLLFFLLLTKPAVKWALGAAVTLLLVQLCTYYYFFYCVLAGLLMVLKQHRRGKDIHVFAASSTAWILVRR